MTEPRQFPRKRLARRAGAGKPRRIRRASGNAALGKERRRLPSHFDPAGYLGRMAQTLITRRLGR